MSVADNSKTPFAQSTGGVLLIQGVLAASVSAGVTWVINNAANLPWPSLLIVFLGIAGLITFGFSLFPPKRRVRIWGWVPRSLGWLAGLRITSARQRRTLVLEARESGLEQHSSAVLSQLEQAATERDEARTKVKALTQALDEARASRESSERARLESDQQASEWKEKFSALSARWSSIEQATLATPVLPPPDPRWHLSLVDEQGDILTYEIRNLVPGSSAFNVRMETRNSAGFHFGDAAFWQDLSGSSVGQFRGERSPGWPAFEFVLEWLDHEQERSVKYFDIPASTPF